MTFDEQRAYKHFEGMENEYLKIVDEHKKVKLSNNYSQDYIREHKQSTKLKVYNLIEERVNKAQKEAESMFVEEKERARPTVSSYQTTEEKLLQEQKRSNNMIIHKANIEAAENSELVELFNEHKYDDDFMSLLKVEIKKRIRQDGDQARKELALLGHTMENNTLEAEYEKFKAGINGVKTANSYENMSTFPIGIENGIKGLNFRFIDRDLA